MFIVYEGAKRLSIFHIMDDDSIDLDTSWVRNYERMSTIDHNYKKDFMDSVCIVFIYLNTLNEIVNVVQECEVCIVEEKVSVIKEERILRIIEEKRHIGNKVYHLEDILKYNVDIESERIQPFVNDEIKIELTSLSNMIKDIVFEPSIFIFHEINHMYVLFKETLPKSILRKKGSVGVTKKVQIVAEDVDKQKFKRFMRKSMRKHDSKPGNVSRKNRE